MLSVVKALEGLVILPSRPQRQKKCCQEAFNQTSYMKLMKTELVSLLREGYMRYPYYLQSSIYEYLNFEGSVRGHSYMRDFYIR